MDPNWPEITKEERIAPPGKFRIVCISPVADPAKRTTEADLRLVKDVDDETEAIMQVYDLLDDEGDAFIAYQAHNDKGDPLVG